jgi:WD40 repeat protein
VKFSRDGNRIAAGSSLHGAGEVRVFDANNSQQVSRLDDPTAGVFAVTFTADGKHVASGGFDGYLRLSDAATGKLVRKMFPVPIESPTAAGK